MARKRGGLAGIWDRNKGVIKTVAPAVLSFIPGVGVPLAAAAGAAMGGFDRPGKGGIGFDVAGGVKGGIQGAAIGKGTQLARSGLSSLMTAKAAPTVAKSTTGGFNLMPSLADINSPVAGGTGMFANTTQQGSRIGGLLRGARENWDVISGVGKAIGGTMASQTQEDLGRQELELRQREYEDRRRREDEAREGRRRLTMLLLPYLQSQLSAQPPSATPPTLG